MQKFKLKRVSIAVCIALMPLSVFAAGLGKLNVSSGLGEPFRADIELMAVTADELSSLTAAIANDEAYTTQGIERPAMHNNIQIELSKNNSGNPILKLKTNQPVNDPFLDVLIQLDWASGRLLREYTVLLDPPGYTGQVDKSNISQSIQAPSAKLLSSSANQPTANESANSQMMRPASDDVAVANNNTQLGKKNKVKQPPQPELAPAEANATEGDYTTKRGDTLSTVAKQMQVEGVSLDQMLVGLYEANPKAFSGGNMNRLKAGQIIRAPSAQSLNALGQAQAHSEVKLQSENWNAYRNKLAGMVKSSTAKSEDANKEASGGKLTTAAEDKAAQTKNGSKDVVKLSSGDKGGAEGTSAGKAAQAKVAMQEDAIAKAKALKEDQDKATETAKIQKNKDDLLALKNKQLADLQNKAKESAQPTVVIAEPAKIEPAKSDAPSIKLESPATSGLAPAKPEKVIASVDEPKPVINKNKPAPVVVPAPEPVGFLDGILGGVDTVMLGLGGGAFALLGGGWLLLRNKRKSNLANFEQGILTSGGLKANTVFGNTSGGKVDTGDTSFLTDFSQSTGGSMIDTNDVDPIAEAEVYMAYGREAQAEEILKDAIVKEPKRYELHLKLLEIYAARKDTTAYETIASELYTTLGAGDPTWEKVATMGATIEPENPLYKLDKASATHLVEPAQQLNATDFPGIGNVDSQEADFSLGREAPHAEDANAAVNESFFMDTSTDKPSGFDFDLGSLEDESTVAAGVADTHFVDFGQADAVELSHNKLKAVLDDTIIITAFSPMLNTDVGMGFNADDFAGRATIADVTGNRFNETLPNLTLPEVAAKPVKVDSALANINFDSPDLGTSSVAKNSFSATTAKAKEISFDFEHPSAHEGFSDIATLDIGHVGHVGTSDAKTLDLSGISLDLNDAVTVSPLKSAILDVAPIVHGSAEIETKLELVSAYLEMEDKEGAKELLEEVLKEGGVAQVVKARALLASIA